MNLIGLLPDGMRRAIAGKAIKWLATMAAGAAANWLALLLAKYGLPTDGQTGDVIKEISGAVFALVAGGGALLFSLLDAKNVNGKMAAAAAAGFDKGQARILQQAMQQGADVQASAD